MTVNYPLQWPEGWPRTHQRKSGKFGTYQHPLTFDRARRTLFEELARLGARQIVLSSQLPIRGDGMPYADAARRRMDDPGVAIYFTLKGKQLVMAQDAYYDIASNVRSLALAIEGLRQLERHGGATMMQRAFNGFAALPAPEGHKPKRPWWEVLRYSADPADRDMLSVGEVEARYRHLSKTAHPDGGGSAEAFNELTQARDEAVQEIEDGTAR